MEPKPKKWKVSKERWDAIRSLLISEGGTADQEGLPASEVWRIRLDKAVFTMYATGTLFSNPTSDPVILEVRQKISALVGEGVESDEHDFFIGLDETGKGEVLGHCVLAGVVIPSKILSRMSDILGVADTKKKRTTQYWDILSIEIDREKRAGLRFIIDKIPPWHVDRYNINKIMDVVYQRVVAELVRNVPLDRCRITLDDYGMGFNLSRYLQTLSKQGAKVRVESKADENYPEVKLAAAVAKREREKVMEAINKGFGFPDCPVGSGNAGDPQTLTWLKKWKETKKQWPWFVKTSFSTVRELDGFTVRKTKEIPPIRDELLSEESRSLFREGKLSTSSLAVICPRCGIVQKSCKLTPSLRGLEGRCTKCIEVIPDLNATLRYYCGYVIPDSSIIISGSISKDLQHERFFEGFTFMMHPTVLTECDNRGGKAELSEWSKFASMGRIDMQEIERRSHETEADTELVECGKFHNAIILTGDKLMLARCSSKGVFALFK